LELDGLFADFQNAAMAAGTAFKILTNRFVFLLRIRGLSTGPIDKIRFHVGSR
jgi:hypothetical protein